MNTLWGKVFKHKPTSAVINFTAGRDVNSVIPADYHLLPYDIWGSKAHCVMLSEQKIINNIDAQVILKGLKEIEVLIKDGTFLLDPNKEDVHTNIESWLIERYGIEHIGKLHTARSRNDQSNVDTRLYIRDKTLEFIQSICTLNSSLINQAEKYKDYVMPGFTHHQHAMMTTFGHILLAFTSMLVRDTVRFTHWYALHNYNPLGSAAGYGTTFPINQQLTTKLLGFDKPEINSLDQITNRWEPEIDLVFAVSVLMNHLSLIAQTFILFATPQFGMITLADEYSTGSSIMPQKKNPDPLEVIKGKTAYISGLLQTLLSLGKANFIGYNRDSQWSKYVLIDAIEETLPAIKIMQEIIETIKVNKENMEKWCHKGFIGAPTLMEQIASKHNVSFRKSKMSVEKAVKYSSGKDKVTYEVLKKALEEEEVKISITKDEVKQYQDPYIIIQLTKSFGGPGKKAIKQSSKLLQENINQQCTWLDKKNKQKQKALRLLEKKMAEICDNS